MNAPVRPSYEAELRQLELATRRLREANEEQFLAQGYFDRCRERVDAMEERMFKPEMESRCPEPRPR